MNKKLIAVAVASVFALPFAAQADSSNVTVYGIANVAFDNASATGAGSSADGMNSPSRNRITSYASRIGFKGTEDLGNGMAANFQLEEEVALDGSGASGGFTMRNSYVGLSGKTWGEVRLGTHDTPFKLSTAALDPFADSMGDYNSVIGSIGNASAGGAGTGASSTFELRPANVLAYITPDFNGFTGIVGYVANEGKSATPAAAGAANKDPRALSLAGIYKNGPIYAALGWEKHYDLNYMLPSVAASNETETGTRLGLGYSFGDANVGFVYETLKADNGATGAAVSNVKRNAWTLNGTYKMGANTLKAAYIKGNKLECGMGDGSSCEATKAGTDVKQWVIGVDHAMSKRTAVYALYTQITNNYDSTNANGANYNFGSGSATALTVNDGADPKGFSIGIKHSF